MSTGFHSSQLLPELGFKHCGSDEIHDWVYAYGKLELTVIEGVNRWFQPSLVFIGDFDDGRTAQFIEFIIASEAKSRNEALALIGYYLRDVPSAFAPPWLGDALALSDHLPWNTSFVSQKPRETCSVAREWFRLPCKTIRSLAETTDTDELAEIFFDGRSLSISAKDSFLVMPADGTAWACPARVELREMRFLPKRLVSQFVNVALFDSHVRIAGVDLNTVPAEGSS